MMHKHGLQLLVLDGNGKMAGDCALRHMIYAGSHNRAGTSRAMNLYLQTQDVHVW
jgi:hypothetical protein